MRHSGKPFKISVLLRFIPHTKHLLFDFGEIDILLNSELKQTERTQQIATVQLRGLNLKNKSEENTKEINYFDLNNPHSQIQIQRGSINNRCTSKIMNLRNQHNLL